MTKEFKIKPLPDRKEIWEVSERHKIGKVLAALLIQRGLKAPFDVDEFIEAGISYFHDPFLLKDMDKAVKLLGEAKDRKERVWVFGDYDIDGMSSLAILYTSLVKLGFNVRWFLPERKDDFYDLQTEQVEKIAEKGCDLLITSDCGSNAREAVALAKKKGMKVIVTDHHIVSEPAKPDALINPMQEDCEYPYKFLCGTGVAYKLIMGYTLKYSLDPWGFTDSVMDYLCLATVADFMPLTGENRAIVKTGLKFLADTDHTGLAWLLRQAYLFKDITVRQLQFKVIPKLNSAGRMGRTRSAFELLAENDQERAERLYKEIEETDRKRRELEEEMLKEAVEIIKKENYENDSFLVVYRPDWESSLCGNVAAKLCKKYNRPCIAIGKLGDKPEIKGSGRNNDDGVDIFRIVEKAKDCLKVFGGHRSAVGVTLYPEDVDVFRKKINECFEKEDFGEKETEYDLCLKIGALDLKLCADIEKLAPFGEKNPEPVFVSKDLEIRQIAVMGKDKKHTKIVFEKAPGEYIECVKWNWVNEELRVGDRVDVAYTLEVNDFNFQKTPQMMLKEISVRSPE